MRTYFGIPYFNIGRKYICFFDVYESEIFKSKKEMICNVDVFINNTSRNN